MCNFFDDPYSTQRQTSVVAINWFCYFSKVPTLQSFFAENGHAPAMFCVCDVAGQIEVAKRINCQIWLADGWKAPNSKAEKLAEIYWHIPGD